MPVKICWPAVAATTIPAVSGLLGGFIVRKNIHPWYESLKKPSWTPPNWIYGPVWTSIYCATGYSSYLVWRDAGGFNEAALPLSVYGLNMVLNLSWSPIFFGTHNIKWALYEIVLLWGTTAVMGVTFYRVNMTAGLLITPYLIWNTLAVALNYVIYRDNELEGGKANSEEKSK